MKFIFVDSYYPEFLKNFYGKNPSSEKKTYDELKDKLLEESFGTSDFYSYNLKQLGHSANDIIVNDEVLQKTWARENNIKFTQVPLISKIQLFPYINRFIGKPRWIQDIALAQIENEKPDVLYIQNLSILNADTLSKLKKYSKLIVGQIASPMPQLNQLIQFDLIISSFPHFVKKLKSIGINSEYLPLAFEPRILKKIDTKNTSLIYDVSFVGNFTFYHRAGTHILEEVAKHLTVNIWGPQPRIGKNYHGEAWGLDMYRILAQSKIVINRHIDVAQDYANNMRMYESTGMGSLLITDEKKNINELFSPGKEIITYKNTNDLIDKIKYYLRHEKIRSEIAQAGQKRTLREHNYLTRMKELVIMLNKYL